MARNTLRKLSALAAAEIALNGAGGRPSVRLVAVGKASDPRWKGVVTIAGTEYDVADDSGKVKLFSTVDSFVKLFATMAESANGVYALPVVDTGALYASKVPANIYTDAESKIVRLNRVNVAQTEKYTALQDLLDGPMLGWNTGNAAQQARYAEVQAQLAAINADTGAIAAEIARLQAIVDSQP